MKKIFGLLLGLILFTGCGNTIYSQYKTTSDTQIKKDARTYTNLTYKEYDEKIKNEDSFILFIWKTGCSHCESFEPKLNEVISNYKLEVYGLNIAEISEDEFAKLQNKTFVEGTPTTVYFKNGKLEDKMVGDKDQKDILAFLEKIGYLEEK